MKSIFIVACLIYSCHSGTEDDFRRLDSLIPEDPCSYSGGNCIFAEDCPKGLLTNSSGLCPKQKNLGVECCYGFSVKETRCQRHGGECVAQNVMCNKHLIYSEATDCAVGTKCCILV